MTLADDLKPLLNSVRAIPGQLGLRPYQVAIIIGTWSGEYVGGGSKFEQARAITEGNNQPPKVRFLDEEALALSGSSGQQLLKGSCTIGPITPVTTLATLLPAVSEGQTVHVRLTGPAYPRGAKFAIKKVATDRALHWTLTCEPVEGAT